MSGTVREARLSTPKARSRLRPGRQPNWQSIIAGRDHLGYQRWPDEKQGRWVLRRRRAGRYSLEEIGRADDVRDIEADGVSCFSYDQARAKAVELSATEARPAGRLTVNRAIADYVDFLRGSGKGAAAAESMAVNHILPALGNQHVDSLTSPQLRRWLASIAAKPANGRESPADDESIRRRRVSANRILKVLKAALNHAYDEERVASNDAWGRRVKPFAGVASPRTRHLSIPEAVKFLNACEPAFRNLARAALETGCRYGELTRLEVADFDAEAGTVLIRKSKTQRSRHVVLTAEGQEFFASVCRDREPHSVMLTKANGKTWRNGDQGYHMGLAIAGAKLSEPITFHGLRHTWASLSVMGGVPLQVVARNLGHVDTKVTEQVYSHMTQSYVSDSIRAGAPRFDSVTPLRKRRSR